MRLESSLRRHDDAAPFSTNRGINRIFQKLEIIRAGRRKASEAKQTFPFLWIELLLFWVKIHTCIVVVFPAAAVSNSPCVDYTLAFSHKGTLSIWLGHTLKESCKSYFLECGVRCCWDFGEKVVTDARRASIGQIYYTHTISSQRSCMETYLEFKWS